MDFNDISQFHRMGRICGLLLLLFVCDILVPVSSECVVILTSSTGTIKSPNHPRVNNNNVNCTYVIENPTGQPIILTFRDFNIPETTDCKQDYIEIVEGKDAGLKDLTRLCGKTIPRTVIAISGTLLVKYISNKPFTNNGFSAEFYECKGCVHHMLSSEGLISYYTNDTSQDTAVYIFDNHLKFPVELQFTIELDDSKDCLFEYVQVKNGVTFNSPVIATYCGNIKPDPLTLISGPFAIMFHTDKPQDDHGFSATFHELRVEAQTNTAEKVATWLNGAKSVTTSFNNETEVNLNSTYNELAAMKNMTFSIKEHEPIPIVRTSGVSERDLTINRSSTTVGIVVASTVLSIGLAIFVAGIVVRKRKKGRGKAVMKFDDNNGYGSLQSSLKSPPDFMSINSKRPGEINIIFNANYFDPAIKKNESEACIITPIDNVESDTPSIITNINPPKGSKRLNLNDKLIAQGAENDFAIEEGPHYSFTLTPKCIPEEGNNGSDTKSQKRSSVESVEDDSILNSLETSDGNFDGATLKILE